MLPKYELTKESRIVSGSRVYRICALRDFGNVKAGEFGGWVESEHNLAHDGHCWVGGDAVVRGNARVCANAQASGDARIFGDTCIADHAIVYDNTWIYGTAFVRGNARVYGYARIYGNARIYTNAQVDGHAQVSGYAQVSGDAWVKGKAWVSRNALVLGGTWTTSPTQIQGSRDYLTHSSPGHITIGCQTHPVSHWLSEAQNIGKRYDYTDVEIEEYLRYIRLIDEIEEKANAPKV